MIRACRRNLGRAVLDLRVPPLRLLAVFVVEIAADPVEELIAAALRRREQRVMHGDEADAAVHQLLQRFQATALQQRVGLLVAVGTVAVKKHGRGVVEDLLVARPAVGDDLGGEAVEVGRRVEALLEEAGALFVLVLAGSVALGSGDENDLFIRRFRAGGAENGGGDKNGGHGPNRGRRETLHHKPPHGSRERKRGAGVGRRPDAPSR